jgi:membrane-associated phospholipid phosphatase
MVLKDTSIKVSAHLTYAIGNIITMFLLFFVLLSNVLYDWVGHLYPIGAGFRLDFLFGGLDDLIPFVPEMIIFYLYLYVVMAVSTMVYFAFIEYRRGYALGWSLVTVEAIALIIYVVFPVSVLAWHQDLLANPIVGNFWASQVYSMVASFSTAFNTFPSMHAAVSTICFYTWYEYSKVKPSRATKMVAIVAFVIAAGTILSTLLLKQHYIADEIAGIGLGWIVSRLLFRHFWKPS